MWWEYGAVDDVYKHLLYHTLSTILNITHNPVFVRGSLYDWMRRGVFYPPGLGSGSFGWIDGQRRLAEAWVWVITRNPEGKGLHLALAHRHLGLDRNQRGPGAAGRAVSPLWHTNTTVRRSGAEAPLQIN